VRPRLAIRASNPAIALHSAFRYVGGNGILEGFTMADHSLAGSVEMNGEMDYPEHEKTYRLFVGLAKYGTLHTIAILIAMAFSFFTSAGFFSGLVLFVVISLVGIYLLRRSPEHVA
jgi:hypothetical protein